MGRLLAPTLVHLDRPVRGETGQRTSAEAGSVALTDGGAQAGWADAALSRCFSASVQLCRVPIALSPTQQRPRQRRQRRSKLAVRRRGRASPATGERIAVPG